MNTMASTPRLRPALDRRVAAGVVAAHVVVGALGVAATARVPAGGRDAAPVPLSITVSLPALRDAAPVLRTVERAAPPPHAARQAARAAESPAPPHRDRIEPRVPTPTAVAPIAAPIAVPVAAASPAATRHDAGSPAASSTAAGPAEPAAAQSGSAIAAAPPAPATAITVPELVAARPDHDRCPRAGYPLALKERGIEGTVWLRVQVSQDGQAGDVSILRGSGWRLFDEAALQAARGCRFIPARRGDERQASWVEFPMRFALSS